MTSYGIFQLIHIRHDAFFQFVFIFWCHNAVWVAAFEVDADGIAALRHSDSFAPVDFMGIVAICIFD